MAAESRVRPEAARLGIARALCEIDAEMRPILKKNGFMTRDPREVERKKPRTTEHVASSSSVNVNHCVHRAQNGNKYRRLRFSYYSVVARLRKTAGIVQDTTATVDVKRILIRDLLTIRKQCQELILINCWKPEPTSVT